MRGKISLKKSSCVFLPGSFITACVVCHCVLIIVSLWCCTWQYNIWRRWQWRGTPHSPKLQYYWKLIIRLLTVLSCTLVWGVLLHFIYAVSVLYSPSQVNQDFFSVISRTLVRGVLPLGREAVGLLYSPSRLGKESMDIETDSIIASLNLTDKWQKKKVTATKQKHLQRNCVKNLKNISVSENWQNFLLLSFKNKLWKTDRVITLIEKQTEIDR